jgi:predicted transcriptional regulator
MMLYGAYISNAELVSVGALLALIGKTVPSMTTTTPTPAPVTPTPAPAAAPAAKTA